MSSRVRNPVLGWKNRLVGTVKDDIMLVNEVEWPAMVAGVGHMGNVGLIYAPRTFNC